MPYETEGIHAFEDRVDAELDGHSKSLLMQTVILSTHDCREAQYRPDAGAIKGWRMNSEEQLQRVNRIFETCVKDVPDLLLAKPWNPIKGNWRRFICKFKGHRWQDSYGLVRIIGPVCLRCCQTKGGMPTTIGHIESQAYNWWRSPVHDKDT